MRRDTREWTVPRPFRALLWWPPAAFVLAIATPDDAVLTILLAGILLLAAGALTSAVQRESSIESDERPTVELPPLDAAA